MRVYFYPPPYPRFRPVNYNPYTDIFRSFLKGHIDVVNLSESRSAIFDIIRHLGSFNVIIFNWIENVGNKPFGQVQFAVFFLLFLVLKVMRVKVVWVMHNFHPHSGEGLISHIVKWLMLRYSDLIVTHSKEAKIYTKNVSKARVAFFHHPVGHLPKVSIVKSQLSVDVLIWGSVEPYKGIVEFLEQMVLRNVDLKVRIVGKCSDHSYARNINELIKNRLGVVFENRRASFEELSQLINSARFVLFPYTSDSVSSSGALMDTICYYGSPVGPNKGAFKDLHEEGVCFVYDSYDQLFEILKSLERVDCSKIDKFLNTIGWQSFVDGVVREIQLD